jgi:hypothetical protein
MLRVRTNTGKVIDVEEPLKYVEILDKSGNVAMLFYMENVMGDERVNVIYPGMDEETNLYSEIYKVKWSDSVKGDWIPPEPAKVTIMKSR